MIILRPMEFGDLYLVNAIRNQSLEFLHDPREFTLEETEAWFNETKPNWYIIEYTDSLVKYVVDIGYFRIGKSDSNPFPVVGADIHPNFRGLGLGYEAWKVFLNTTFETEKDQVVLECLGDNIRAYNLYRKLGFEPICCGGKEVIRNGRLYPSIEMCLLKEDWLNGTR